MRHHHRRNKLISNINVVPYLDVLLVLLVIFMITTPLFSQGVIDIPKVGDTPLPTAKESALEILYEQKGVNPYRLKDHKNNDETAQLSVPQLITELKKKEVLYEDLYIIISADGGLAYEEVVRLLGELRDAGFNNLALAAENTQP